MTSLLNVFGFHRSGTSLVAQYMTSAGCDFGDNLMPGNYSNKSGHFEDQAFVNLNRRLLSYNQWSWLESPKRPIDSTLGLFKSGAQYLASRSSSNPQGFKDPRTYLTLDFWESLTPEWIHVITVRDPTEVVSSILRRSNMDLSKGQRDTTAIMALSDPDTILKAWIHFAQKAIDLGDSGKHKVFFFDIAEMRESGSLASELNAKFSLGLSEIPNSTVFRSQEFGGAMMGINLVSKLLLQQAIELYEEMMIRVAHE